MSLLRKFAHLSSGVPVRYISLFTSLFFLFPNLQLMHAATASTVVQQLGAVFSPSGEIKKVTLNGQVTRYTGVTSDTGNATLTALDDGSGILTLSLSRLGQYVETEEPASIGRSCSWQDATGTSHQMDYSSCAVPLLWFMPSMALQPGTTNTVIADLGNGSLGGLDVRLLSVTNVSTSAVQGRLISGSPAVRVGLDPIKLLPVVMEYEVHPDDNPMATVKVDISYGNWSIEQGVEVPHSIQRRFNGALDLDIQIQAVSLN